MSLIAELLAQLVPVGVGQIVDVLGLVRGEERRLDPLGEDRPERDQVGVDPRMGLHVRVVGAEQRLGVVRRQSLDLVDVLATGIEAMAGRALGVLVAEPVPHGEQHRGRCVVLRSDQFELAALVGELTPDVLGDRRFRCGDHVECGPVHVRPLGCWQRPEGPAKSCGQVNPLGGPEPAVREPVSVLGRPASGPCRCAGRARPDGAPAVPAAIRRTRFRRPRSARTTGWFGSRGKSGRTANGQSCRDTKTSSHSRWVASVNPLPARPAYTSDSAS